MSNVLTSAVQEQSWQAVRVAFALSDRELDVLRCLFGGQSEKEVAECLVLSPHTVHTYLRRLARKLGVRNRAALVTRVLDVLLAPAPRSVQ
jgi:DNA-binding CsgD family transcriptional regulator